MSNTHFENREDGGRQLSLLLKNYKNTNSVVLGIPRGGVVTAKVIAENLELPLGLIVVRKIGHPSNPEYAIGAISESGLVVANEIETSTVDPMWLNEESANQLREAKRRREKYWGTKKTLELKDKNVILVDDGLATGLTMLAAIKETKSKKPAKVIVAVPVSPKDTFEKIKKEVDEFVVVDLPEFFEGAVGSYYDDFPQVEDEEVISILGTKKFEDPLLFYTKDFDYIGNEILKIEGYKKGNFEVQKFPNGEFLIRLQTETEGTPAVFLGSISPPFDKTTETFSICHTIKKEGAKHLLGIFPYLSFMRHDKDKHNESQLTSMFAKFIKDAGIDEIWTFDIHSENDFRFFEIPIKSFSSADLFVQKVKELNFVPSFVVSPDVGATKRAEAVREKLGINNDLVVFSKERIPEKDEITTKFSGNIFGDRALIIDDMIDTGQTLLNCVKILKQKGVNEVVIAATHGIFSVEKWRELYDYGVKNIIVTNSIPSVQQKIGEQFLTVDITSLILDELKKYEQ